jgi:hypothetical protein
MDHDHFALYGPPERTRRKVWFFGFHEELVESLPPSRTR